MPEELGGAGATAREAAVVMEEIGRAVAPVPYLSSACWPRSHCCRPETPIPSGTGGRFDTAALAVPLPIAPGDAIAGLSAVGKGVSGRITSVAGAVEADVLVVPVAGRTGCSRTPSPASGRRDVTPILAWT